MSSYLPGFLASDSFFRILIIIGVAIFLRLLVALFLNGMVRKFATNASRGRVTTLTSVLSTIFASLIWVLTFIIILKEIGFDITPLIASAGVVGIAVGFGAQTLVKDLLSGFFLLIEDQFREGDEVEIADKRGLVERASLRTVTLREKNGQVTTIPYSVITVVTNFSRKR